MPRVKRGNVRTQKRNAVLQHTKGFKWRRKNVFKIAVDAMRAAAGLGDEALRSYQGRKQKKRDKRALWQVKINAAARQNGTTYGALIHNLKKNNSELDRKVLADIAEDSPATFAKVVEHASK